MKKYCVSLIALFLALCLVFPVPAQAQGALELLTDLFSQFTQDTAPVIPYSEMEYVRPDLEQLQSLLDEVCRRAEGEDVSHILDGVFEFYDAYDWFFTASALAQIRYSADLTDSYWEEENNFCTVNTPAVQQMLEQLNTALAQSPCREKLEKRFFGDGFFDRYGVESFWDDELVTLMERESQLVNQYYTQYRQMTSFLGSLFFRPTQLAQTLVELIQVRNQIAACGGYDSYEAFANDFYYYRDYDPEDMAAYLEGIRETLVPLYYQAWEQVNALEDCEPDWAMDYLRQAVQDMGGTIQESFQRMEEGGLYDNDVGPHRFNSSFEAYLTSYQEPFLFLSSTGTTYDALDIAHEFGHFCNDDASWGSIAGMDVSEIFSQGMEYLTLCCHPEAQELLRYKMADSLSTYVEQACYARFEQEMYQLTEPSVDDLCGLYEQIFEEYGLVDEYFSPWDFVTTPHFYTSPMYVFSYIVSNDAALQLYQMECDEPGQGLRLYQRSLDTQQPYFLAFLEEAGLESPFAPGRLEEVAETFCQFFAAA